MTVFIAKLLSRVAAPPVSYDAGVISDSEAVGRAAWASPIKIKSEYLAMAFIFLAAFAALVYIIELNVIIHEGRKLAKFEAVLEELEHEQKVKYSLLASIRSPSAIKKEAIDQIKMVEVKNVRYLDNSESVAANIIGVP